MLALDPKLLFAAFVGVGLFISAAFTTAGAAVNTNPVEQIQLPAQPRQEPARQYDILEQQRHDADDIRNWGRQMRCTSQGRTDCNYW